MVALVFSVGGRTKYLVGKYEQSFDVSQFFNSDILGQTSWTSIIESQILECEQFHTSFSVL